MRSHIHIVCSDQARNGKSLFARLYADCLSLGNPDRVHVFDTDFPNGGVSRYFPQNSEIVDLSKTGGQVRLFDTMIAHPGLNYVVDLQASLLNKFFDIFHDIRFDEGAEAEGIGIAVFFIVDRSMSSIAAAEAIRGKLSCSEFILVRNDAIGNLLHLPSAARNYMLIDRDRELAFPKLSAAALDYIEFPGFTFSDFIARGADRAPYDIRQELWGFLESIYNQREAGSSGTTLLI